MSVTKEVYQETAEHRSSEEIIVTLRMYPVNSKATPTGGGYHLSGCYQGRIDTDIMPQKVGFE